MKNGIKLQCLILSFIMSSVLYAVQVTVNFDALGYARNTRLSSTMDISGFNFETSTGLGVGYETDYGYNNTPSLFPDFDNGVVNTFKIKRSNDNKFNLISIYLDDTDGFGSTSYRVGAYNDGSEIDYAIVTLSTAEIKTLNFPAADYVLFTAIGDPLDVAAYFDELTYEDAASSTAPTTQASAVSFSGTSTSGTTISWTNGDGASRAVFMAAASSGTASPVDNTNYSASVTFGVGNQIGSSGWYCVYNGTGTSVSVSGLSESTIYRVHVCEYNEGAGSELYLADAGTDNPDNVTTDASLPVELTSFSATGKSNTVELTWTTASERDNLGFIIERKSENTDWKQVASYQSDNRLAGKGTTSAPSQYDFIDNTISAGADYDYRLSEVNINGEKSEIGTTSVVAATPSTTQLFAAYPNPFNPSTTLNYSLAKDSHVTMAVYDILGREIKSLVNQQQSAGQYSIQWDGSTEAGTSTPSGTYLVRMQTGNTSQVQKVLFMK